MPKKGEGRDESQGVRQGRRGGNTKTKDKSTGRKGCSKRANWGTILFFQTNHLSVGGVTERCAKGGGGQYYKLHTGGGEPVNRNLN